MEFPICKICLKNDILCQTCSAFVSQEKIPQEEIDAYRQLNKLLKGEEHLKDIKIKRALGDKSFLLIITTKDGVSKIIGKNGIIVKKLSKDMKRQIRVLSDTSNIEELTREVLYSTTILGINVLYTPNGKKYRIRIPFNDRITLPIESEAFTNMVNHIFGDEIELVFE